MPVVTGDDGAAVVGDRDGVQMTDPVEARVSCSFSARRAFLNGQPVIHFAERGNQTWQVLETEGYDAWVKGHAVPPISIYTGTGNQNASDGFYDCIVTEGDEPKSQEVVWHCIETSVTTHVGARHVYYKKQLCVVQYCASVLF